MKHRDIHLILDGLAKWHDGWLNLEQIDWLLGAPVSTIATLFFQNQLADIEGRPLDGTAPQDAVNVLLIFLAMRQVSTVRGKFRASSKT
ncbi:hypothetical protein ES703_77849 [subsurface metagenome]